MGQILLRTRLLGATVSSFRQSRQLSNAALAGGTVCRSHVRLDDTAGVRPVTESVEDAVLGPGQGRVRRAGPALARLSPELRAAIQASSSTTSPCVRRLIFSAFLEGAVKTRVRGREPAPSAAWRRILDCARRRPLAAGSLRFAG